MLSTKALDLNPGSYETIVVGDRTYVVEVLDTIESTIPEFENVKTQVVEAFKSKESVELAKKAADTAAEKAKSDSLNLIQIAKNNNLSTKDTELIGKSDTVSPPFTAVALKNTAFALSSDSPITKKAISLGSSHYLVELLESKKSDMKEFSSEQETLAENAKKSASNNILNSLIETLRARKDFKINPEILKKATT